MNLEIAPMAHLEQKGFKGQLENNEKWVYFQTKGVRFYQYAKHLFFNLIMSTKIVQQDQERLKTPNWSGSKNKFICLIDNFRIVLCSHTIYLTIQFFFIFSLLGFVDAPVMQTFIVWNMVSLQNLSRNFVVWYFVVILFSQLNL